ncbi:hypothetical protein R1flu_007791 [Riccia fluitans]|uniref:Uncharacterized protein n=1 Tax=Riccia fluitans TaxID=41844 RepID=A0ABD1Z2X2_9MARC
MDAKHRAVRPLVCHHRPRVAAKSGGREEYSRGCQCRHPSIQSVLLVCQPLRNSTSLTGKDARLTEFASLLFIDPFH